ncbi:hypothetical protein E8E13_006518 [Curvularia kusanoi]|uniref:Uncharacterized protein n=1 Tax=Curvularia kusanoi TaxID=90978 RepID=A0A9P4T9Q7_CURKU|nr:hypothetical protein E8E13_006518 [Curvularia kusanoi]
MSSAQDRYIADALRNQPLAALFCYDTPDQVNDTPGQVSHPPCLIHRVYAFLESNPSVDHDSLTFNDIRHIVGFAALGDSSSPASAISGGSVSMPASATLKDSGVTVCSPASENSGKPVSLPASAASNESVRLHATQPSGAPRQTVSEDFLSGPNNVGNRKRSNSAITQTPSVSSARTVGSSSLDTAANPCVLNGDDDDSTPDHGGRPRLHQSLPNESAEVSEQ